MKIKCILFSAVILLLLLTACSSNYDYIARRQFANGDYAIAIENYDRFIAMEQNGAEITKAELDRAECYYQLGMKAYKANKFKLAIRFMYLSNLEKADRILDRCYMTLAERAGESNKLDTQNAYYEMIINNLDDSDLMPEVLFKQIDLQINKFSNDKIAWIRYMYLYDHFPKHNNVARAQVFMDDYIPGYVEKTIQALDSTLIFNEVVDSLNVIASYPTVYQPDIMKKISRLYVDKAEENIADREYIIADSLFRIAIEYNPEETRFVNQRLNEICNLFVVKGDSLVSVRAIDAGIRHYRKSFTIIADYAPAVEGIKKAEEFRVRIEKAEFHLAEGEALEAEEKYPEALAKYRESYKYDPLETTAYKIFIANNMIKIEEDPIGFAKEIIAEYKNGMLFSRINKLENRLIDEYGDLVRTSEWRYMLSIGQSKYEVRYDITTPDKNYFFVWLVNLREKKVSPLNPESEKLIDGKLEEL